MVSPLGGVGFRPAKVANQKGAPYHRAQSVKEALEVLQINLEPLPAYSPDFMPVEHLWQWLREDVTYHTCYRSIYIKRAQTRFNLYIQTKN
ncbi:MAG: hypothetical protein HC903_05340 [Methylacidiphilales bacterium]|nr:hypothetical protein [Candidatus Methylacidiphilales bacterium]NJR14836.1 hypothetical protein [Calothrix sp. CSU_2_0]